MNTSQILRRFFIGFVFLLKAHAHAGTSLPPASESMKQMQVPQLFDLKEVLTQTPQLFYGIDFEDAKKRQALIAETKKYLNYRKHPLSAEGLSYLFDCSKNLEGVYCSYEMARITKKEKSIVIRATQPVKKEIAKWLEQLNIEKLQKLSYSELTNYLKSFSNSKKIDALVEELKNRPACSSAALLTGVAAKLEEYFPDEKYRSDAKALYARAVGCGTDPASLRAAFRLSLLEIWSGDCEVAAPLLSSVVSGLGEYQSRAKYWRHYCALKLQNQSTTASTDLELKNESPINFQNILLHGNEVSGDFKDSENLKMMTRSVIQPQNSKYIEAVEALTSLHEGARAAEFLEFYFSQFSSSEPELKLYLATLMHQSKNTISEFHILSQLFVEAPRMIKEDTLKMYFPLSFYEPAKLKAESLDPLILLSIMRQESAFNPHARSRVGARGLMQVMPPTARFIASASSRNLYDPATNMKVGVKLFLNQLERFSGDAELALAAYNAGSLKVEAWKKRYPIEDKMLFLELIPYKETREYVTMILRNYYWYQRLYRPDEKTDYKMPSLIERIFEAGRKPAEASPAKAETALTSPPPSTKAN